MGTTTAVRTAQPSDVAGLRKAYAAMIEDEQVTNGTNPYSGSLATKAGKGICVLSDKLFATSVQAAEWIMANEDPDCGGPAVAVRYVADKPPADPAVEALRSTAAALEAELAALPKAMIERARSVRSATRGCRACGSAIAVAWIGKSQNRDHFGRVPTSCPVCGDGAFLETKADVERRARLEAAIRKAREDAAAAEQTASAAAVKRANPEECPWLIVAGCRS